MIQNDNMALQELCEIELDMVAAGAVVRQNSLVNLNNLVSINVGVGIANQSNVAVLSNAVQGGAQLINLSQLAIAGIG